MKKKKDLNEKTFIYYMQGSIKCKYSGHSIFMIRERGICTHCGHWNYRNKKTEFKYKTQENIIKEKRKNRVDFFKKY